MWKKVLQIHFLYWRKLWILFAYHLWIFKSYQWISSSFLSFHHHQATLQTPNITPEWFNMTLWWPNMTLMIQEDTRWHKTTQDDVRMTQVVSNKVFPRQFERSLTILDSNLLKLNLVGYDGKLTLTDLQGDITGDRPSIAVARHRDKVVNVRWAHDLCYVGRWKCWWSCCCD